jgi:DNA polymerase-3 subunit chi
VRFLVDGAEMSAFSGFVRIVCLFDGRDPEATAKARAQWKAAKAADCAVTYWRQSDSGRWEKQG